MTQYLDFNTISPVDPWTTYPSGWQRTSSYGIRVSVSIANANCTLKGATGFATHGYEVYK